MRASVSFMGDFCRKGDDSAISITILNKMQDNNSEVKRSEMYCKWHRKSNVY